LEALNDKTARDEKGWKKVGSVSCGVRSISRSTAPRWFGRRIRKSVECVGYKPFREPSDKAPDQGLGIVDGRVLVTPLDNSEEEITEPLDSSPVTFANYMQVRKQPSINQLTHKEQMQQNRETCA
jgi:hypothetical protein